MKWFLKARQCPTSKATLQTKPANLRDVLETKLKKQRKNILGPPAGKKMYLFIDDLNIPALVVDAMK
jgi:dynein heavy chain